MCWTAVGIRASRSTVMCKWERSRVTPRLNQRKILSMQIATELEKEQKEQRMMVQLSPPAHA